MDNKVGDHMPSPAKVQEWLIKLKDLKADMEKYTIKLSPDDKRHLLTFRPGGEKIVALISDLADKYGIKIPDMPTQGMRDDLTLSQRLAPVASELGLVHEQAEDTIVQARSEAWQATTGNYSVLLRVAEANPALAKEIAPAREFFAKRRKPVGDTPPPAGAPPAGGGKGP